MKSYAARLKEAQRTIITDMSQDTISMFAPILEPYGYTKTSSTYDKAWEQITVTFKDPARGDSVDITCDCDSHKFNAVYYPPGQKYEEDSIDECSLKRFTTKLTQWLDGLGWECPVCEGEGTIWPDDPDELNGPGEHESEDECKSDDAPGNNDLNETTDTIPMDEQLLPCPHCQGTRKTRQPVDTQKAA